MTRRLALGLAPLLLSVGFGCGGTGSPATSTAGTGGVTGAGGATGVAGGTGTAGRSGAGGAATGTGGAASGAGGGTGVGGVTGSGGGVGSGGATGAGGAIGSGGNAGVGGSGAGAGGATGSGGTTDDYTFCNYGSVPSGTAPGTWTDNPTLTPIGQNPYGAPSLTIPGGYILISEGPQGTTQVPQATQSSILTRINNDLKFETAYSYIHLPPWSTGRDRRRTTSTTCWSTPAFRTIPTRAAIPATRAQYPDVETTQVAMTDQTQRYDLTHEFNHVLENSYGTVPGHKVSWIQESYNDYLILLDGRERQRRDARTGGAVHAARRTSATWTRSSTSSRSSPSRAAASPSTDGSSVNGPADYFTDITGYRYNDLFPLFVAQRVGQHFFAAVWEQAKTTEQILQTMTRLTRQGARAVHGPGVRARAWRWATSWSCPRASSASGDRGMYAATTNQNGTLTPVQRQSAAALHGAQQHSDHRQLGRHAGQRRPSRPTRPAATARRPTCGRSSSTAPPTAPRCSARPWPPGATSITLTKAPKNNVVVVVITNVTMDGYKARQVLRLGSRTRPSATRFRSPAAPPRPPTRNTSEASRRAEGLVSPDEAGGARIASPFTADRPLLGDEGLPYREANFDHTRWRWRGLAVCGGLLLLARTARADGAFPDSENVMTPAALPDEIALATNFGLVLSVDDGQTWTWTCEQPQNSYGSLYQIGAQPLNRLYAVAAAGLVYLRRQLLHLERGGRRGRGCQRAGRVPRSQQPEPGDGHRGQGGRRRRHHLPGLRIDRRGRDVRRPCAIRPPTETT